MSFRWLVEQFIDTIPAMVAGIVLAFFAVMMIKILEKLDIIIGLM